MAAIAAGLESVRFRMPTPSLIDDWFALTYSRPAIHALIRGDYSSAHVDFPGRYRPAYTAVWNYAQWHLIGSPSIVAAAVWGLLHVAFFVVSIWLLTTWLAGKRSRAGPAVLWTASLAVAMTPAIAVDLVRHSPSEPMMVAGLITGLALFGAGIRMLLANQRVRARTRAISVLGAGYLLYLFGVYSKETSICFLAFAPFFLMWLGPQFRTRLRREARSARYLVASSAVLLVAPLLHVGIHLALSVSGGRDPYPNAHFSLGRKVVAAAVLPLIGAPGPLKTLLWLVGTPAAIAVAVVAARRRERDAWLLFGVLATGFLMSAFALARGDTPSRYYIPWIVAVAAVALRGLARTRGAVQLAVVAIVVGIALSGTRNAIADWAETERSGSTATEMAKGVIRAECPLYLANFDVERRVAIPLLLGFGSPTPIRRCAPHSDQAYALSWRSERLPADFNSRCRLGWKKLVVRDRIGLFTCRSFTAGSFPDQNVASGRPEVDVVRIRLRKDGPDPRDLFQRPGA